MSAVMNHKLFYFPVSNFLSCCVADCEVKLLEFNEIGETPVTGSRRCAFMSVQYRVSRHFSKM